VQLPTAPPRHRTHRDDDQGNRRTVGSGPVETSDHQLSGPM
jgi:hypothetical protein